MGTPLKNQNKYTNSTPLVHFLIFRVYFTLTMTFHADLASTFEKLDLVAIDVNEGWTVIRRRLFIDLFIKEEPFSSVEILHHYPTKVR